MYASRGFRFTSLMACLIVAFSFVSVGDAEARKGGSFGSRGMNTFNSPAPTQTAPAPAAPIQRTMTPNQQQTAPSPSAQSAQPRGGFMNGFGGALMRGVFIGGLFGLLFGGGFGGIGGVFAMLAQVAIIGGVIWLALRLFRPRTATAGGPDIGAYQRQSAPKPDFGTMFGTAGTSRPSPKRPADSNQLGIGMDDLEKFQSMLTRVQAAFAGENYAALRTLTTPEVMGYLSEELATNATNGVKNQVSDVTLLQGDLAESWREGQVEYATVAMRYSAVDYMVDRSTGAVVEGDAENPGQSTEIWTFVRNRGDKDWRLSAIQAASS